MSRTRKVYSMRTHHNGDTWLPAQVLGAAVDRLMDPEERVRIAAIEGIGGAAMAGLDLLDQHLKPLTGIADRLRDLKPAVARAAAEQLLAIFKVYTVPREQGAVISPGMGHDY